MIDAVARTGPFFANKNVSFVYVCVVCLSCVFGVVQPCLRLYMNIVSYCCVPLRLFVAKRNRLV